MKKSYSKIGMHVDEVSYPTLRVKEALTRRLKLDVCDRTRRVLSVNFLVIGVGSEWYGGLSRYDPDQPGCAA